MLDNSKRYRAYAVPTVTFSDDEPSRIEVVSTRHHPVSHYGQQVFVDKDGEAYGQINLPFFGWELEGVEEISEQEAELWLAKTHA